MTIHDFDMVRFLAGCNATEVYVEAAVLVDPAIGEAGDVDTAVITLKMENGAIAVIDNSRKAAYGYDREPKYSDPKEWLPYPMTLHHPQSSAMQMA